MRRPDGAVAPARNPQFRRFWLCQSVSLLGDQVSVIAVPLVAVLTLDASAAQMGYLVAAELAPNLLFSHTRSTHSCSPNMLVVAFLMGSLSVLFQVSYSPLWFLWLLPSPILGLRTLPEAELDDAA